MKKISIDEDFNELDKLSLAIQESIESCLLLAKQEVRVIIQEESTDKDSIQKLLNFLLGVIKLDELGNRLFITLLDYYKKIDAEDALVFWQTYDERPE